LGLYAALIGRVSDISGQPVFPIFILKKYPAVGGIQSLTLLFTSDFLYPILFQIAWQVFFFRGLKLKYPMHI
jgi:hypothetical protein